MEKQPEGLTTFAVAADASDQPRELRALAADVAGKNTTAAAAQALSRGMARILGVATAVLSREHGVWRFEAEAFPTDAAPAPPVSWASLGDDPSETWTVIAIGSRRGRGWILLVPGSSDGWRTVPGFGDFLEHVRLGLEAVSRNDDAQYARRLSRRLHAFARRLAREAHAERVHALVLRTLAVQTGAETAALAVYNDTERGLAIVATLGYHQSMVEHLRIAPGEGIIGRAFSSGSAALVHEASREPPRRLR